MTNHWIDIGNSDCILIIGSNAAENHPISFKWVTEAMDKGAKLISADPRFTRTSAKADLYVPLRSGTDIALMGGLIKYILDHKLYNENYVIENTNALHKVGSDYSFSEGLFSGYDAVKRSYDKSKWAYQVDEEKIPIRVESLDDPDCVFAKLREQYAAYDLDTVSKITGTPVDTLEAMYKTYAATGQEGKAGTIMYAMGTTQHTNGTQMIRAYAMVQLLLGNIGVAGGGVNALRGESNVQGSTDHCLLFHILPGYLKPPVAEDETLEKYIEHWTPKSNDPMSANWWQHTPKYIVSLLKAWWGDAATPENEFAYQWLPKRSADYSWISLFEAMHEGVVKGLIAYGQNPAVGGPNSNREREAMRKLDWLVVMDLWETETAAIWKEPGINPTDVQTEVWLLPAACSYEKEGSITNSGRWMQWRWKALDPPGEARHDLWIVYQLVRKIKGLYAAEGGPNAEAILKLTWDYGPEDPDVHLVAKEINGYAGTDTFDKDGNVETPAGKQVANFVKLRDDGSTACGNWLYSGSYTEEGNMAARRNNVDTSGIGLYLNWAWCWPLNRRIIYNRASVYFETGQPRDPEQPVIRWDPTAKEGKGAWVGDVPDGGWPPGAKWPFIMKPEGFSRLYGFERADGPFPVHYEPWESPVDNLLYPKQCINPAFKIWACETDTGGKPLGKVDKFPYVATTYRVSEHWQAGQMTRNQPWLVELMPEMFVELSEELAAKLGIKNGEKMIVESARGSVEGVALVTKRFKPFSINGRTVHQVGLPWHWGYMGLSTGDSANLLTPHVGDANTMIPEFKAFLVNVRSKK